MQPIAKTFAQNYINYNELLYLLNNYINVAL